MTKTKILQWIRWYFVPTGGVAGYTLRVGVLWYAPLMFLTTHVFELGNYGDYQRTSFQAAVECLTYGLLFGLGGHPIGQWVLQMQSRRNARRRNRAN